jgi:phytoene dehydrogenase-like protein
LSSWRLAWGTQRAREHYASPAIGARPALALAQRAARTHVPLVRARYDVVVVGAGPNGLAAAITLAQAKLSVLVVEARETPGGGARSAALTLPGFLHDVCSAVHPLAAGSPFFRTLGLERHGLAFIQPPSPVAHVLADGSAVTLERSIAATAAQLGSDGAAYRELVEPFVERFDRLMAMFLGPLRLPHSPVLYARFGLAAVRSMQGLARRFRGERARALLAGVAAHSMLPLDAPGTAAFALVLATAGHAVGWPIARGGSRALTDALVACLREHGGELELGTTGESLDQLPPARARVLDVAPRQLLAIARGSLPSGYCRRLQRFRHGPGVFKMDWALSGPLPWKDPACARAATVHLSGSLAEVAAAEAAVHAGRVAERPFVLLAQPSLFDPGRAPPGRHTLWAYCHVPNGAPTDAAAAIEAHIERFAPGFRDLVLHRSTRNAVEMERANPSYVGGDINGGQADLFQLLFRPVARLDPYATPVPNLFLCSASTPPGGGVHGMCGYWAARSVLARVFGRRGDPSAATRRRRVLEGR